MPEIYLSPSLQEYNPYLSGGSEEYYMNLIADAMEPYLEATGIAFVRNDPSQTLGQVIEESNSGDFDIHLALHSNAAPESLAGQLRGPQIYFSPVSSRGNALAEIITDRFRDIYPEQELVQKIPTTTLREITRTTTPAVLVEVAYHDEPQDEAWIRDNIDTIARSLVQSLADYFGMEFKEPDAT